MDDRDAPEWGFKPGHLCGKYEIIRPIGRGGYGEVYEVVDPEGVRWALKALRPERRGDKKTVKRVLAEATILRNIDHINVVRYHDSGTTDWSVWIVLEYLEGQALRHVLHRAPQGLPIERALRIARQICDGAAQLHAFDAVHRDIKPENIFILQADLVKLLDFGIAKVNGVHLRTTRNSPIGTALYMAPDLLKCETDLADPRWDVYALGVVTFEMIVGRHPFETSDGSAPTHAATIARHIYEDIPPLGDVMPGVPGIVSACVQKATEREPRRRFQTMKEFAAALTEARFAWEQAHGAPTPLSAEQLERMREPVILRPAAGGSGPALRLVRAAEARAPKNGTQPMQVAPTAVEQMPAPVVAPKRSLVGQLVTDPMLPTLAAKSAARRVERAALSSDPDVRPQNASTYAAVELRRFSPEEMLEAQRAKAASPPPPPAVRLPSPPAVDETAHVVADAQATGTPVVEHAAAEVRAPATPAAPLAAPALPMSARPSPTVISVVAIVVGVFVGGLVALGAWQVSSMARGPAPPSPTAGTAVQR